jgi:hypothetical protein
MTEMHDRPVTVTAVFDRLDGTPTFTREVVLDIHGDYVWMHGGPTGYESLPASAFTDPRHAGKAWLACFGTPGVMSHWDYCEVPWTEFERAGREMGLIV